MALAHAAIPFGRGWRDVTGGRMRHIWQLIIVNMPSKSKMSPPEIIHALAGLGRNLRRARLARRISIADLAKWV